MRRNSWSWRRILVCFLALVLLGGATDATGANGGSAAAKTANPEHTYAAVDAFLREQIEALGIPGAAVAVVRDGAQVHSAAFGRADDSGRPLTPQTPVLLASTSKSFTSIAVMQQVEAGRLRLDEPVQTYLPWFTLDDPRSSSIHRPPPAPPVQRHGFEGHGLRSLIHTGAESP